MYKKVVMPRTSCTSTVEATEGETIEKKIERFLNNGEPIGNDDVQLHYTERKDGVIDAYNIRTDKFEVALDAMDRVSKSYEARRSAKMEVVKEEETAQGADEKEGKAQSVYRKINN